MKRKRTKSKRKKRRSRKATPAGLKSYIHLNPGLSSNDKHLLFSKICGPSEIITLDRNCIEIHYKWKVSNAKYDPAKAISSVNSPYNYVTATSKSDPSDDKKDIEDVYLCPELGESGFFESSSLFVDEYEVNVGNIDGFQAHYQYANRLFTTDELYEENFGQEPHHLFTKTNLTDLFFSKLQEQQFNQYDVAPANAIGKTARFSLDGKFPFSAAASIPENLQGTKLSAKFKRPVSFLPGQRIQIRLSRRTNVANEILQRKNLSYEDFRKTTASTAHYRDFILEITDIKIAVTSTPVIGKLPKHIGVNYLYAPFMNRAEVPANSAYIEVPLLIPKHAKAIFISFYPNSCLFWDGSLKRPLNTSLCLPLGLTSLKFNLGAHHGLFTDEFKQIGIPKKAYQESSNLSYYEWLRNHNLARFQYSDLFSPNKATNHESFIQGLVLDLEKYDLSHGPMHLTLIASFLTTQLSPSNYSVLYCTWIPTKVTLKSNAPPDIHTI